jgi:glycosyltransferase involved in cell wall biosynthesis
VRVGISGYIGPRRTGIGRSLEDVLTRMATIAENDEFHVWTNYDQEALLDRRWPANVKLHEYPVSKTNRVLNIAWHQLGFQRSLRQWRCDCSLIPNFSLLVWTVVPTIVVIHDMIEFRVAGKFSPLQTRYRKLAVPMAARVSDKIITVSESSRNDVVELCGVSSNKITVIHNGYDASVFYPRSDDQTLDALGRLGLERERFILWVGTIDHPGKNLYSVIQAYDEFRSRSEIPIRLAVVGATGYRAEVVFERARASRWATDICFCGVVSDDDLAKLYSSAIALCFTSLYEGFGLPVIEAMACGCPVVTSSAPALREVAGDSALIVDALDIVATAESLHLLVRSSTERQNLRDRGLRRVSQFGLEEAAESYLEVLRASIADASGEA